MPKKLTQKFEEVRLVYSNKIKAEDRPKIKTPTDAYRILIEHWDADQIGLLEECKILLLDRQLRLMSIAQISKGGTAGTVVDPKIIFSIALKRRANNIILAHNHPSGSLKPSEADISLTKTFIKAGRVLELPIADHIIITQEGFCSMFGDYFKELHCDP